MSDDNDYVYHDGSDDEEHLDILDGGAAQDAPEHHQASHDSRQAQGDTTALQPEKMSKRKRKKLEQLQKKKELQDKQKSVLDELQQYRLSAKEIGLLNSTARNLSSCGTRRAEVLAAKRAREEAKDEEILKKAKIEKEENEKRIRALADEEKMAKLELVKKSQTCTEEVASANKDVLAQEAVAGLQKNNVGRGRRLSRKNKQAKLSAEKEAPEIFDEKEREQAVAFGAKPGQRGFLEIETATTLIESSDKDDDDDELSLDPFQKRAMAKAAAGAASEEQAGRKTSDTMFVSLESLAGAAAEATPGAKPAVGSMPSTKDNANSETCAAKAKNKAACADLPKNLEIFRINKNKPNTTADLELDEDENTLPPSATNANKLLTPRGRNKRITRKTVIEEQRSKLPAIEKEQEVIEACLENDVILVAGDTGCGKSTQVPQFLYENGFSEFGCIAVTQPRRVAAISVAQRVGDELALPEVVELQKQEQICSDQDQVNGGTSSSTTTASLDVLDQNKYLVGYQVRYDKSYFHPEKTKLKFLTDGIVLREIQHDFLLPNYSTIILDEAHERSVNCDILIGMLSRVVEERRRRFEAEYERRKATCSTNRSSTRPKINPKDGCSSTRTSPTSGAMLSHEPEDQDSDHPENFSTYPKTSLPLKLIIMSATLRVCDFTENTQLFSKPPPVVRIDAKTFPVAVHFDKRTSQDYPKDAAYDTLRMEILKVEIICNAKKRLQLKRHF